METMVQPKVLGYRQLSEEEAALMNEGKELAELCGAFVAKLRQHPDITRPSTETQASTLLPLDQRWISLGATDLQTGFMAIVRGIAQPTTF